MDTHQIVRLSPRQKAITAEILRSPRFIASPQMTGLFGYLCDRYSEYSTLQMLWQDTLKNTSEAPEKKRNQEGYDWATPSRNACKKLKFYLAEYFANTPHLWDWRFELPLAVRRQGYRLELIPQNSGAALAFWRPHLEQKAVTLVYAQPMFYIDTQTAMYLRFSDTNPEKVSEAAVMELEQRHGDVLKKIYDKEQPNARLRATHYYIEMARCRRCLI
jgi:hypothetical protein